MNAPLKLVSDQSLSLAEQIEKAANEWRSWKHAEDRAKENRLQSELKLIELFGFNKLEGSQTIKTDDGNYKISFTAKLDRKLDEDAYRAIEHNLPDNMRPVRVKLELDTKGIKWMEENAPDAYALVAPCITTKPAKTAVKVEFIGGV